MAKSRILFVGPLLQREQRDCCDFDEKVSLLDWDVVVFSAWLNVLSDNYNAFEKRKFGGKQCLTKETSVTIRECFAHWRTEILDALNHNVTIIVILDALEEFYYYTGKYKASTATPEIHKWHNLGFLPGDIAFRESQGFRMKLTNNGKTFLASYWDKMVKFSEYVGFVTCEGQYTPCVVTSSGDKPVGIISRSFSEHGAIVILPSVPGINIELTEEESKEFDNLFIDSILSIHRSILSDESIDVPDWVKREEYISGKEYEIRKRVETILDEIVNKKKSLNDLKLMLQTNVRYKLLLFSNGKILEEIVMRSIEAMGYEASHYENDLVEIDIIFSDRNKRFIGEVEGKDNKQIQVGKIRQLITNITEDFSRDDVDEPAKPVLFGNPERLFPLEDRGEPFSNKCQSLAQQHSVALVKTSDLFFVVQYLLDNDDEEYAAKCRDAIFNTTGLVQFPEVPKK